MTFSVNFYLRLANFGYQKLRKAPDDETMPEAYFKKSCLSYGRKFPRNDQKFRKTKSFYFLNLFMPFFVQCLSYFLPLNGLSH